MVLDIFPFFRVEPLNLESQTKEHSRGFPKFSNQVSEGVQEL